MIVDYGQSSPELGNGVFIAPNATVLGQVEIGADSSIWYGCVLRGDVGRITIGERTNIQDLSVIHVTTDKFDTIVGDDVTVGHRVILHGCTIEAGALIGMGSIVMDGATVGCGALVGAGAVVTPGTQIPPGGVALGAPAKVVRTLSQEDQDELARSAPHYVNLGQKHASLYGE